MIGGYMSNWEEVRRKVYERKLESTTWLSDLRNLLKIIDAAEELELNPDDALNASVSNLRTIIKPLKNAISKSNKNEARELFKLASTLHNRDLRDQIGGKHRETIYYDREILARQIFYKLMLSEEQFLKIKKTISSKYTLQEQIHISNEKRINNNNDS
jgi:hypothetical protein